MQKSIIYICCLICILTSWNTSSRAENEAMPSVYTLLLNNAFIPTRLKAVMLPGNIIRLTWQDNARDEQGFKLQVTCRNLGDIVPVEKWFLLGPNMEQFDINLQYTGLMYSPPKTFYNFVLFAFNDTRTERAEPATLTVPGDLPLPVTPTALTAVPVAKSSSKMHLSWTDESDNEQGFRIYRSLFGTGAFSEVGTVAAGVTSFEDSGLLACLRYEYRVYAYNSEGFYNGYAQTTGMTAPAPPRNLRASQGTVLYQVYLDWESPSVCAAGYTIYHLNSAGDTWEKLNDTPTTMLKADVFNVTPGKQQFFRLSSVDSTGHEGSLGEYVMGWAASPVPVNNWASRGTDNDYIWLHWDAVQVTWDNWPPTHENLYADGYVVAESTSASGTYVEHAPFSVPDNHLGNPLLYRVTGATPGQHYFFKVAAIYKDRQDSNGNGNTDEYLQGDWSAPMEGWRGTAGSPPPTYLSAPSSVQASDGAFPFKIHVAWSSVSGASQYEVYRGSSPWGPWQKIRTVAASSMDNTTVDGQYPIITNTGYYYFVCPLDTSGVRGYCSAYDGGYAASHILQR